ncbi:MAG: hypothetical protein ACOYK5_05155 [Bacteroidia bacterium]|jgi:hypothetical protein
MRPFLLVLIFGSLFASLRAQGSLQFNDVKLFTATSNNTTFTVPANKVWKVETAGVSTSSSAYLSISINGVSYLLMPSISSEQGRFQLRLPLWLPAGTVVSLPFSTADTRMISVLEFNIIP